MYFIYDLAIRFLGFLLRWVGLFNEKIRLFVQGRSRTFQVLEEKISDGDKTIWFHCASLGEFEQGRPVLELIRSRHSEYKVVVSFFSPSGYEVQKNYKNADAVVYLPLDTKSNARRFLDRVHPELAIFVKYEIWPNILAEMGRRSIPAFLISGIFRPDQVFFKFYGGFMRKTLSSFTHLYLQNQTSLDLLKGIGIHQATVSGDTRFDRVTTILSQNNELGFLETIVKDRTVIVAGSTWAKDEEFLSDFIISKKDPKLVYVIAPHHIDQDRIGKLQKKMGPGCSLYSDGVPNPETHVFIVDTIGLLTKIYSYAQVAIVGGGFDPEGVHNVLEPAVFGVPIAIGPKYDKYAEVVDLVDLKGCLVARDQESFNQILNRLIEDPEFREETGDICHRYIESQRGATETIVDSLSERL